MVRFRACLFFLTAVSTSVASAAEPAIDDFVGRVNATIGSLKAGDTGGVATACARLVDRAFNLDAMAPVTSAGAWSRMSQAQKAAYRAVLSRRAVSDCRDHSGDFAGKTMRLVGVRQGDGGDRFVAVKAAKADGSGRILIWRVRPDGNGRLRAVDVSVNGRSLSAQAAGEAKRILQNSGGDPQALIDAVAGKG